MWQASRSGIGREMTLPSFSGRGKNPVGDNAPGENPATPGSAWGNTKGLAMALRKEKKEDTQ